MVSDTGQTTFEGNEINEDTSAAELIRLRERGQTADEPSDRSLLSPSFIPLPRSPGPGSPPPTSPNEPPSGFEGRVSSPDRPTSDGVAFPFKLGRHLGGEGINASTVTLESQVGIVGPKAGGEGVGGDGIGVDEKEEKDRESENAEVEEVMGGPIDDKESESEAEVMERPGVERFVTARE